MAFDISGGLIEKGTILNFVLKGRGSLERGLNREAVSRHFKVDDRILHQFINQGYYTSQLRCSMYVPAEENLYISAKEDVLP